MRGSIARARLLQCGTPTTDRPLPQSLNAPSAEVLRRLIEVVGPAHALTMPEDQAGYLREWRDLYIGKTPVVLRPGTTEEVSRILAIANEARVGVVPQAGNTGLVGGQIPSTRNTEIVLNIGRLDKVRAVDADGGTMVVDAGITLARAQDIAAEAGRLFPLSLASEGSCQIGGVLASNAGGVAVLSYGNARNLALGLEVVLADGRVWNGLRALKKDNTGYDLRDLFIGSEGTLGVITAATLKLYPRPAARLTAWAAVPSMQAAVDLLGLAHRHLGAGLTGFEVMGQFALGLVDKHYPQLRVPLWRDAPYCVLLENSDHESEAHARALFEHLLEAALEAGCASDAVVAESLAQAQGLWHIRESIPLAQAEEGLNIKHDISIPIARIPAFVEETDALLAREIAGVRLVNFGHLGDGNLHYNVQAPEGGDAKAFLRDEEDRINTLVFDSVARHAGSISAEHGVGSLKAAKLPRYKSKVALDLMRAIKGALDPQGIMNPGRILA